MDAEAIAVKSINEIAHKMLPMMRQLEASELVVILEKLEKPTLKNVPKEQIQLAILSLKDKAKALVDSLNKEITT